MKFSKSWLQKYVTETLPDDAEIVAILNEKAFEVEENFLAPFGSVFDIKVLPNRAHDALGHMGMAHEIAACLWIDASKKITPTFSVETNPAVLSPKIVIKDEQTCTRFMSVRIDGISFTDSPDWLRDELNAIGQKSRGFIVDITNYVQFSINKPMHAYDASLIEGNTLVARFAEAGEKLVTLDDKELELDASTLVIADAVKPLGLAGIKGGKFSGISSSTTSIILESANFNPSLIRKTSQKYDLKTDASKRFENGIANTLVEEGLLMTTALIKEQYPNAEVSEIVDIYPTPDTAKKITFTIQDVNAVLGSSYNDHDVTKVLAALSIPISSRTAESYTVEIPPVRLDLTIKEDIIEEIGRIMSFQSLPKNVPSLNRTGLVHKRMFYEDRVRNILVGQGFSEVMTYTFGDTGVVELVKGLASDKEKLRSNLSSGVQKAFQMNMLNAPLLNLQTIKMYEFGNVFTKDTERRHLALIIDDGKKKSSFTEEVDLLLSQIKRELGVASLEYETVQAKPYTIELDFDTLIESLPQPSSYEPLTQSTSTAPYKAVSPYPFIARDIAMWVPGDVTWEDIRSLVTEVGNTLIARIDLFDTFEKEIDGVRKVSYAFRLVFQSFERTLTDEEVNEMMNPYYEVLKAKGYEIR